ncbi:hypothetical protein BGZ63DRAFT_88911 [Mariannaea sp. PMI_226]|nr:hypothetical protein BGZ63DRAFT_88911 [Mariannaea sp. PMI_226]
MLQSTCLCWWGLHVGIVLRGEMCDLDLDQLASNPQYPTYHGITLRFRKGSEETKKKRKNRILVTMEPRPRESGRAPSRRASDRLAKRASNACTRCRRQKIKCSGSRPCEACQKRNLSCQFDALDQNVLVNRECVPKVMPLFQLEVSFS